MQLPAVSSPVRPQVPYFVPANQIAVDTISKPNESAGLMLGTLPKALAISAQEIIQKINAQLKSKLPGGIESLSPEETTPEATADRIVSGIALLFDAYQKQNPELSPDELVEKFMSEARSGVEKGYGDAVKILEELGAFKFDGVKDGVEKTKSLIEEKLLAFEAQKRADLGLSTETSADAETIAKENILAVAGKQISVTA